MKATKILIIGGYGAAGLEAVKILSDLPQFEVYVGGVNPEKAKKVALDYNCNWKYTNVDEKPSIEEALKDIDIVLNCFIRQDRVDITVAEIAANIGIRYVDIAGLPLEHHYTVKELDGKAKETGALLITGCGMSPGIIGLLLKHHVELLKEIDKSEIFLAMGANLVDISVLSLIGIGNIIQGAPKIWKGGEWIAQKKRFKTEYVGAPFHKRICYKSGIITTDIASMPTKHKINQLEVWLGIENYWAAFILYVGVKMGRAKTKERATRFLRQLKKMGRRIKCQSDPHIMIRSSGTEKGQPSTVETSFYCDEVFAPALATAIVCSLIYERKLNGAGAFYATEIINSSDFVSKLKEDKVKFKEVFKRFKTL